MNTNILSKCKLCPRECGINRINNEKGYCKAGSELIVARAALHMWEEPCISGEMGSGTVFFAGCSLRCVFCQNNSISSKGYGKTISIERLSEIFIELQDKGANNINLVTPTHYVLHILDALHIAKERGLKIPIVYNTSGYEKKDTLKLLDGMVDVYLPDFKYFDNQLAKKYSNANNYFEYASEAIDEMVRQVPTPIFDERGLIKKGVIVRHLALPNHIRDSKNVIKYLYSRYKDNIFISIMNQYTPMESVTDFSELNRRLTQREYDMLVNYAIDLGIENGYIQEGETAAESFIPKFDTEGV